MVVFSLLVKLGFWQFERGNEKQRLERAILARADVPYQDIFTILERNDWREESVIGTKVKANVAPTDLPVILLDNQTFEGAVGYLAFQVVSMTQEPTTLVLLELGFVKGEDSRSVLPQVKTLQDSYQITGRLYRKSVNPLSSDLMAEIGDTIRVQNLNIHQLSQLFNIELMPAVFQPDNLVRWPYPFPWNPLPLTSAKHFGYSFQWFAMASVFLFIMAMIFIRWLRQSSSRGGEA